MNGNRESLKFFKKIVKKMILLKNGVFRGYLKINTVSGIMVSYLRMNYLEEKLPKEKFVRIHKSYIISTEHIQAISSTYIRINNYEIPIGRFYKARLDEILRKTN